MSYPTPYPPYPPPQPSQRQTGPLPARPSANERVLVLVVLVLLLLVAGGAYYVIERPLQDAQVAGVWEVTLHHNATTTSDNDRLTISQRQRALTIAAVSEQGSGPTLRGTGSVAGQKISLNGTIQGNDLTCMLHLSGMVTDANHMQGTWNGACTGIGATASDGGTWSATRTGT